MRWKPKVERHKSHELKKETKFLWWPLYIHEEWLWLETVTLRYRWRANSPWSVPAGIECEGEWELRRTQEHHDKLHKELYDQED